MTTGDVSCAGCNRSWRVYFGCVLSTESRLKCGVVQCRCRIVSPRASPSELCYPRPRPVVRGRELPLPSLARLRGASTHVRGARAQSFRRDTFQHERRLSTFRPVVQPVHFLDGPSTFRSCPLFPSCLTCVDVQHNDPLCTHLFQTNGPRSMKNLPSCSRRASTAVPTSTLPGRGPAGRRGRPRLRARAPDAAAAAAAAAAHGRRRLAVSKGGRQ